MPNSVEGFLEVYEDIVQVLLVILPLKKNPRKTQKVSDSLLKPTMSETNDLRSPGLFVRCLV